MYEATIYNKTISAKTIAVLKRRASEVANKRFNPIDVMEVYADGVVYHFHRFNRVYPNNTIERGAWI